MIEEEDNVFEAYHGVTGAQHQLNINRLSAQGYRMISLSVLGVGINDLLDMTPIR